MTLDPSGREPGIRKEPLDSVLGLGRRDSWVFTFALLAALLAHSAAGARAASSLPNLRDLASLVRAGMAERLRFQVDIAVDEPPPPPPPPPEPEPEPEPAPPPRAEAAKPEPEIPPAAAEAGKILTAEEDPDAPVDLTDQGFVTGTGERYAGGVTSKVGTAKTAVRNAAAAPAGIGTGTPNATIAVPAVDRSRPPTATSGEWSDCGFPPEADLEGVNFAKVQVAVTVAPDGRARSVTVLKDPGYGFGALARSCALRKIYAPGLNAAGEPVVKTTAPMIIRFTR